METNCLTLDDPRYPTGLRFCLGDSAPKTITACGNLAVLGSQTLALFCSVKCPGNLIVQTYDLAQKLRAAGVIVIGGFHSPMERECLRILLRSPHPVIVCAARGLPTRVPTEFRRPLEEGRLLLLSLFANTIRRADEETAHQRNRFVAALADNIFVAYAAPNSKTELFCREILAWRKPLYTLGSSANDNLLALGAKAIKPTDFFVSNSANAT
jgi:predicted Rossmann fold nucleotide-binding protein DprA/Smf involved in DNA uptake